MAHVRRTRPAANLPGRRPPARLALLALALGMTAVVQVPTPAAQAAADDPVAGKLRLSPPDSLFPNQGNSGYDATHYDVGITVDVAVSSTTNRLATTTFPTASTTMTATTTGAPLSSFSMDFQGSSGDLAAATLDVGSVVVDGQPATFSRIENTTPTDATTDVHKIVITPASPVSGEFVTTVDYSGSPVRHVDPDGSSEGWVSTVDGAVFVNQPVGAMTAFPHNNTPRDKATWTFTIDAPSKLGTSNNTFASNPGVRPAGVVSNGELISSTPSQDGSRTTWVWDQTRPMASELSVIGVGRYDIYTSDITLASGRTLSEWTFIDPSTSVAQQTTTLSTRAQLKQMIDFFESRYGPYPGKSTGLITDVSLLVNYALATQDRPYLGSSAVRSTTYHEIMHQWWGGSVAPFDWNDMVLNEGPATYAEAQFPYRGSGATTTSTEQALHALWDRTGADTATFATPPAAMTQASQLFGAQVHDRGAMALEALRTSIGASAFELLMRAYQATYGGKQATGRRTEQFQALAELIADRDLDDFFTAWFHSSGKPAWPAKYDADLRSPSVVEPRGEVEYVLRVRNTGKVAMAASSAVVSVDLQDVLDDASLGSLPPNIVRRGTTLTWAVPATPLATTTSVAIPIEIDASTRDETLAATASIPTLGGTCLTCASSLVIGTDPIAPAPAPTITGGVPTVGTPLTADTTGWAADTSFDYQWFIDGTPVPGATSSTWTPDGHVTGLAVTVQVTGRLAGFNRTRRTSAPSSPGVQGEPLSPVPTVTGTPAGGSPLTCHPGTWQAGTVFTYAWAAGGSPVTGATGPVYTPAVATQLGKTLTCTVTGTGFGYSTTDRTSAETAPVATGAPVLTPTPTISGVPRVGAVLTAVPGAWDYHTAFSYAWSADGTPIAGATAATFTPSAAQQGATLTVAVTGTKTLVTRTTRASEPTAAVGAGVQVLQPTPSITGTPRPGAVSTAAPVTWDEGSTQTYQWYADETSVPGATTATYTPTDDEIDIELAVEVTSTRPGYTTVTRTSAAKTVLPRAQTLTPTPTVVGTPTVGVALEGNPGTWDEGATLAYQWLAGDVAIAGADGATYTPVADDVDETITFRVTSTRPTYETAARTSAPTDPVAIGELSQTPTPTVTGTPKVGAELTAEPGTWDEGTTLSYRWYADGVERDGALDPRYTPGALELGQHITVKVTGTKPGYNPEMRASAPTTPVADGDQALTPTPTITGTPRVDAQLTAVPGTWDAGTTLAYQWLVNGEPVEGATATTYTPGPTTAGAAITVAVTGSKTGYSPATRTSDPTTPVANGDHDLTPTPTITGTPKVDVQLTGVPGTWDDRTTLTYQWLADGTPLSGATGTTYTPGPTEAGALITFAVTAAKPGYSSATRTSEATDPVAAGDQDATPTPTVTGTPKVGVELTAVPGTWDAGTTLSYRWYADGVERDGALGPRYTPGAPELGQFVTVKVTGTKPGFSPETRASAPTAPVAEGDQALTPTPTVTGTPQVDVQLTGVPGTWDAGTTLAHQWLVDGDPADGATTTTYTPGPTEAGALITFQVTATRTGYQSVTRTSAATVPVAGGDLSSSRPTIGGVAKVDRTVGAVTGAWADGTTFGYQWLRDGVAITGATEAMYLVLPQDAGRILTLAVTGTKDGYATAVRTSEGVAVALGTQSARPAPTVTGVTRVGRTLRATPGPRDAGTTLVHRWYVGGLLLASPRGSQLQLLPRYAGKKVWVRVTARKPGYVAVSGTSPRVGPVRPR